MSIIFVCFVDVAEETGDKEREGKRKNEEDEEETDKEGQGDSSSSSSSSSSTHAKGDSAKQRLLLIRLHTERCVSLLRRCLLLEPNNILAKLHLAQVYYYYIILY